MKLAEIEDAILAAVKNDLPYLHAVETAGTQHFAQDGSILATPPAVLSVFAGSAISQPSIRGLSNSYNPRFLLLAGASNLRGSAEERKGDATSGDKGVYDILDDLRKSMGGRKLTFASGGGGLVVLHSEELAQFSSDGTWISVTVEVLANFVNAEQ
jgi:phage gp37-like protein